MRDNHWLEKQLRTILKKYFADISLKNPIEIRFGREAKYRFGSIKLLKKRGNKSIKSIRGIKSIVGISPVPKKSIITITSMFKDESVPVKVVQYTIAHELTHYAHGFSSANRRLFKYPHHGGVVNRELKERGAGDLIMAFKKWLKGYRKQILSSRIEI